MKKILSLALTLLLVFSLCACGSSSAVNYAKEEIAADYALAVPAPAEAPTAMSGHGGLSANAARASLSDDAASADGKLPELDPDKIIYSAEATIETLSFDDTLAGLEEMIKSYGGWVESSSINGSNYSYNANRSPSRRSAQYTFRIPSDKFSEVMGSLSSLGNVPYSHTYTENVTSRYYDTAARLNSLETQEARLIEMLEKAETIEDIITIDDKLSSVRYQIESLQSTLNNWDRQVSYSSISLSVDEVCEYTPDSPAVNIGYGERLLNSFKNSLRDIGNFFSELLIWLVGALPVLLILAAVLVPLVLFAKRRNTARRAKKAAKSGHELPSSASETADSDRE